VVVVDETDKRMLVRTFEQLLELTEGSLDPKDPGANRSLTYAEAELLRAFNRRFLDHGWSHEDYTKLVRFGAARHLQQRTPGPDEPRVLTPQWAVDRGAEIGAEMVANIRATGVRVIGPLDLLADPAAASSVGDNAPRPAIPHEVAARFAAGVVRHLADLPGSDAPASRSVGEIEALVRARHATAADRGNGTAYDGGSPLDEAGRPELARELVRRARDRVARKLRGSGQ
jgi:hypothetical protein